MVQHKNPTRNIYGGISCLVEFKTRYHKKLKFSVKIQKTENFLLLCRLESRQLTFNLLMPGGNKKVTHI